jgi:hypothetical protein
MSLIEKRDDVINESLDLNEKKPNESFSFFIEIYEILTE